MNGIAEEPTSPDLRHQSAVSRFAKLPDYNMRHLVSHVIEVASPSRGTGSPVAADDHARAVGWLVRLLGNPDFAMAQASRAGAERTVADFVAAWDVVGPERP